MISQNIVQSEASISTKLSHVQRRKYKGSDARYKQKKKKEERLIAENGYLKEIIEQLIANYLQVPAIDLHKQEISASHLASQDYHPIFSIKDPQGIDSENKQGTAEGVDGLGLNDLLSDLLSNEMPINDPFPQSGLSQTKVAMAEFLAKIDQDVASNADLSNFTGLEGVREMIGGYSFPLSLVPTAEKIINVHGDVAAASLMNANVTGTIYILFCATIKEMSDLELDQVTEEKMLKWRDAIKDALRINFKVEFAMNHLKKIARAYFGRVGCQVLQSIDEKLNALYEERAEISNELKECLADAEDFDGKSVSSGLFRTELISHSS